MRALLTLIFALLCLAGTVHGATAFDHAGVARNAVEKHIRPGYQRLAEAMTALDTAMERFCGDQQEPSLDAAKRAFANAVIAWSRVEHLRFGPVAEEHRYERIAFWPDPKSIGARQVSRALARQDTTVTSAATLMRKSVALQGLTALEQVIYGGGGLLGQKSAFRCRYAEAITGNLAGIAAAIEAAWTTPDCYSRLMLAPGGDNPVYFEPHEVTQDLVMAYATGLRVVRNLKIGAPLGLVRSGKAAGAAFAASGLDRAVILANLEGIRALFTESGLAAQLSESEAGAGRAVLNELDIARRIIGDLNIPLNDVAKTPKVMERVAVTGFALKNAYETGTAALKAAAGLSMGFNALDGD